MDGWWVTGLCGAGDGSGAEPPAWADFVDGVLSSLPVSGVVPSAQPRGVEDFAELLRPFAEHAADGLPDRLGVDSSGGGTADLAGIRAAFVRRLSRNLGTRCARVLVLELNVARVTGRLAGDTPSERFRDFVAQTSRRDAMASMLREYPVLARLVGQFCLHAVSAFEELLLRFAADRAQIVATLLGGTDPGALVGVDTGVGDRHRRGRSVAVLRFADGRRVVYKPTPLGIHQHFNDVARWLSDQPGVSGVAEVPVLNLVVRNGYGWVEHVAHRPCTTERELDRFYRRQGTLLALLYALDGTDLHFENLIARGDEPVLIDLEALFQPVASAHAATDPASAALRSSVFRTGLLPHLFLGNERAVDASGLGGDPGALSPADAVDWADPGTDLMRLIRRPGTLAGAANRPTPSSAVQVEPGEHIDALLAGFRVGYQAIAVAGLDDGLLQAFAQDEARVLMRSTQTYATLLAEATHPDVLRDASAKDALLGLLATEELAVSEDHHPAILEQELAQLWDDDVPLFTAQPGSRDLWSGTGTRIADVFDRSSLDRAAERIRGMGDADRAQQEWIIRAAMAARSTAAPHRPVGRISAPTAASVASGQHDLDPERLLDAARDIGDRLLRSAHAGSGRMNWLGLELLGDRYWQLRPCGADLGGGYSGAALFLAQLAGLTGDDRYADAARSALRPLSGVLERLEADPEAAGAVGPGGFAGLGGIAYAVTVVSQALDDSDISALIAPATAITIRAAASNRAVGVADGLSGGLAALLAVHRATGSDEAWRGAVRCATELVVRPLPAEAGMRCGAAGVGWALLGFAEAGGGAEYEAAGLAALRTAVSRVSGDGDSWCEGAPGIALAVADRAAALADDRLGGVVQRAVDELTLTYAAPSTDHSPCHGEAGRLELLTRASGDIAREALNQHAKALLTALNLDGPGCGTPDGLTVPGLLTGLAGIGHGLLRLGFPERTPSALLLRTGS